MSDTTIKPYIEPILSTEDDMWSSYENYYDAYGVFEYHYFTEENLIAIENDDESELWYVEEEEDWDREDVPVESEPEEDWDAEMEEAAALKKQQATLEEQPAALKE